MPFNTDQLSFLQKGSNTVLCTNPFVLATYREKYSFSTIAVINFCPEAYYF